MLNCGLETVYDKAFTDPQQKENNKASHILTLANTLMDLVKDPDLREHITTLR